MAPLLTFHECWKQWYIYDVHNYAIYEGVGTYHMLDGVEDWIRHSMALRALSERKLRLLQIASGWSEDVLVEHLRGDHDENDTYDEEILDRLRFNGLEVEASEYIPEQVLRRLT